LVGVGRNVEEVEAGIAPANRRDKEGVGAAVDVLEATAFLDGPAEMKKALVAEAGYRDSAASLNTA